MGEPTQIRGLPITRVIHHYPRMVLQVIQKISYRTRSYKIASFCSVLPAMFSPTTIAYPQAGPPPAPLLPTTIA